jgi:dihydroflavonol-4-reductase
MDVVVGASGHLGNVLTRELISAGRDVRPIFRSPPTFDTPGGVESYLCDFDDPESLANAFRDADTVYHTAGLVAIGLNAYKKLHYANVVITRNIITACLNAGVRRLVYTGTIEAFDLLSGRFPITEDTAIDPAHTVMPYGKSKALAILEVEEAVRKRGLNALTVFPTGFIGPYDFKISPMTSMVADFLHGRIPASLSGGFDFVDVRDVAIGMISAAQKGNRGDRYLLPGRFITVSGLFGLLEEISGKKGPRLTLSSGFSLVWGSLAEVFYFLSGKQPRYTRQSLRLLSLGVTVSGKLAFESLGYSPRPLRRTLEDTVNWLVASGYCENPATE